MYQKANILGPTLIRLGLTCTTVHFQVLDGLLEEDDEVVETWYLLGWVNKLRATFEARTESETKVSYVLDALHKPVMVDPVLCLILTKFPFK